MNSVSEIRQHIKVVEDTTKITRAMYLVSSSKMKKALKMHEQNMRYYERVRSDIRYILDNTETTLTNPYYRQHGNKAGYIVIAGDKGLCGGYNQEVCKLALNAMHDGLHDQRALVTIGHMASEYFRLRGMNPDAHYDYVIQDPSLQNARAIMADMRMRFRSKELDEVYVVYTTQEHVGVLTPKVLRMLPVVREDFLGAKIMDPQSSVLQYYPSPGEVLESIIPHYLVGLFFSALVQSYASEQYARMTAMDAATRNADDMKEKLMRTLNHARQALITQEISEIISGNPQGGFGLG